MAPAGSGVGEYGLGIGPGIAPGIGPPGGIAPGGNGPRGGIMPGIAGPGGIAPGMIPPGGTCNGMPPIPGIPGIPGIIGGVCRPGVFGASRSMLPMRITASTLPRRVASMSGSTPGSSRVETTSSGPATASSWNSGFGR